MGEGEKGAEGEMMSDKAQSITPRCVYHDSTLPAMEPNRARSNSNGDNLAGWGCLNSSCDGFFSPDLGYMLGTTPQSTTATEAFLATRCRVHDSPRFAFREVGDIIEFACTEPECEAGTVQVDKSVLFERA